MFTEGHLLEEIKLIKTNKEKYKKLIKNPIYIKDSYSNDIFIRISGQYEDYNKFNKYKDVLCLTNMEGKDGIEVCITFDNFDKIVEYVERLKKLKNK